MDEELAQKERDKIALELEKLQAEKDEKRAKAEREEIATQKAKDDYEKTGQTTYKTKDTGKYVCKLPEGKTRDIVAHIHIPAGSENDWYGYVKKYKDPKKPDVHITGDNIRNTEEIKTCLHHLGYRFKEFEIIDLKVPVVK